MTLQRYTVKQSPEKIAIGWELILHTPYLTDLSRRDFHFLRSLEYCRKISKDEVETDFRTGFLNRESKTCLLLVQLQF